MSAIAVLVALLALALGLAVGVLLGARVLRRTETNAVDQLSVSTTATSQAVAPVKESLDRFDDRLRQLESSRVEWHSRLREQVESVRMTGESLRRETASLTTALRRPQVRGRWGEMHLQRAVELAGLVEACDFEQQATVRDGDTVQRPDLVVNLAGGKHVVVDSKVPLDAFLDAGEAADEDEQLAQLRRHARQVRGHVDALAAKSYWKQFEQSPEFVVLFVPGESFLSHALEVDPVLLEYASGKRVILATPTTLIALLRTVAFAWTQSRLADDAREVHTRARELYDRIGTVSAHLDKVGRSLTGAVTSYNGAIASLESRVLVSARRLADMHVSDDDLEAPGPVEQSIRPLTAPELVEPADQDTPTEQRDDDIAARRAG